MAVLVITDVSELVDTITTKKRPERVGRSALRSGLANNWEKKFTIADEY